MKVDSIRKLISHSSFVRMIFLGHLYASHLGVNVRWTGKWDHLSCRENMPFILPLDLLLIKDIVVLSAISHQPDMSNLETCKVGHCGKFSIKVSNFFFNLQV